MTLNELERLRIEMNEAGDRLLLALTVEQEFQRLNSNGDLDVLRLEWLECRRSVEQLSDDYARVTSRWRSATQGCVEEDPIPATTPISRGGWMQRGWMTEP